MRKLPIGRHSALGIATTIIVSFLLATSIALADPIGTSATWYFNLPSTAVASQNPPYPLVATLTLTQTADGVQFLLTPNWSDPEAGFSSESFIEQVDYVYNYNGSGSGLTGGNVSGSTPPITVDDFRWDADAKVKSFTYWSNPHNMDSSYTTQDQHIQVDFGDKNDTWRFTDSWADSEWTVLGTSLSDFTGTFATSNSHPSPIQGVISVTAYSLDDPKADSVQLGDRPECRPRTRHHSASWPWFDWDCRGQEEVSKNSKTHKRVFITERQGQKMGLPFY